MNKFRCRTCSIEWFAEGSIAEAAQEHGVSYGDGHVVEVSTNLTANDYADMWAAELENANRHELVNVPGIILSRLVRHISDRRVVDAIMKDFYNIGLET